MKKFSALILSTVILFVGCSKDDNGPDIKPVSISVLDGKVEKGPFTQGSTVTIQELTKELALTGKSFQTDIANNEGDFKIESSMDFVSPFIQIACDGYFFNEVSGNLSESQVRLESFVNIKDKKSINVNILTHLTKDRIMKLMKEDNLSYAKASSQAREELLTAFALQKYEDLAFEDLTISNGTDGAGALIIISSVLLAERNEAELTEYLSVLKESFTKDGTFTEEQITAIRKQSQDLSVDIITDNIINRYKKLGKNILAPDLRYFIDWDNDGIAGNELGDPNVEAKLFFEVDTIVIPATGGEFKVGIQSTVPFKLKEEDDNLVSADDLLTKISLNSKELVDNELTLKVGPTTEPFMKNMKVFVTTLDKNLTAELTIVQEGDFTNELQNELIKSILTQAAETFDQSHTLEGFYTNCYDVDNTNNWYQVTTHNISVGNFNVNNTWARLYRLTHSINNIRKLTGNTSKRYFITLHSLLNLQLTTLWGDVVYIDENHTTGEILPSKTISEIYSILINDLTTSIKELSEEKNTSMFDVSKNVPRALLAKLLINQKKYAKAKEQLDHIIASGHYTLNSSREDALNTGSTEVMYAINTKSFVTPQYSQYIESSDYLPLVQYSEVLLMSAECANQMGDQARAQEYLNQIRNRNGNTMVYATGNDFMEALKETWKNTLKGGFSYFDFLKRNDLAVSELNIEAFRQLLPIPSNENIEQNDGY
ncbi:MAG: RagB/SusD family nutrient uptake outer membrane protein [Carboxylicivirga sp.]|jgi:hypothetical protein|nr:RagB/SusD family nutrient uptake outer membrane protein [Carboxylicivirga sp.]